MDEVNIVTGFTKKLIGRVIERILRKKIGYDAKITLNEFNATVGDKVRLHVSIDAEMDKTDFFNLMNNEVFRKD